MIFYFNNLIVLVLNVARNGALNTTNCKGIEIVGMEFAKATIRDPPTAIPLLESYEFITYDEHPDSKLHLNDAFNAICQIILQNISGMVKKPLICEIKSASAKSNLTESIKTIFDEQPLVDATYFEVENFEIDSKFDIILINELYLSGVTSSQITKLITAEGFIVYQGPYTKIISLKLELISRFLSESGEMSLLRPVVVTDEQNVRVFNVNEKDFNWIQDLVGSKEYKKVYLLAELNKCHGVMGLINCLRSEETDTIFQAFLMDKFTEDTLFQMKCKNQIRKNLVCNILQNNSWGTYIHKYFTTTQTKEVTDATVCMANVREFSSLQWLETPKSFLR